MDSSISISEAGNPVHPVLKASGFAESVGYRVAPRLCVAPLSIGLCSAA